MKTFFFKLMLLFIPLLAAIAVINYRVDPLHLFSASYYEKAGVLLKEHGIVFESCHEKKLLVEFLKYKPDADVLVAGSSRTAIIDTQHIKRNILNVCTSHVLLEDIIAAYGLYISNHHSPREMVIGLDPWYFNDQKKNEEDFYLQPYYACMLKRMESPGKIIQAPGVKEMNTYDKSKQLFSFDYLQHAVTSILRNGFVESSPRIATVDDLYTKQSNGALHYNAKWQENPDDIATAVKRELSAPSLHGTQGYTGLSAQKIQLLEQFVSYLLNQHVKVTLLLTPYHPEIWKHILNHPRYYILLKAEKQINQIALKHNIRVDGSYDPTVYKLKDTDFYDAIHINYKGLKKMFPKGLN